MAAELNVDEETVRHRLQRVSDARFLQGWQLIPSPVLLGRGAAVVELRVGARESKAEVISRLKMLEGVVLLDDLYGNGLAVLTFYDNEAALERQVALFASLCGPPAPPWWRLRFPPCALTATKTDWRIIQALRATGNAKLSDVARDLALSTSTVKRRLIHMGEGNAFYLDPTLDLSQAGGVRGRFWVTCEPDRKRAADAAILATLPRAFFSHTASPENSLFMASLSNAAQLEELLEWMETVEGVREVRAAIVVEHIHVQEWLVGQIKKRLAALSG